MLDFKRYVIDETTILSTVQIEPTALTNTSFMEMKHTWTGFMNKPYTEKEALEDIERMASYKDEVRVIDYPAFKVLIRKEEGVLDEYDIITTILNIRHV